MQQCRRLVKIPLKFLFTDAHYLSNVHTWAIFFLRHLANMSSMIPSWASLAPALFPIWGPRPKPAVQRRLFIVPMTAAHISPNVFSLRNFLSNIHGLFLMVHLTSFTSFIHHIYTHIYIFYLHDILILSLLRIFMAGKLPSVLCVQYTYHSRVSL